MHSPIYILFLVSGLSGLWLFWDHALKPLLLDEYRERLFALRFSLFRLGMQGKLPFDSDVYRQIETLLCGLLRFGHNVTFLTFFMSRDAQERARKEKGYIDLSAQLTSKIACLQPEVKQEVDEILIGLRKAILRYISFTSLLFLTFAVVVLIARLMGIWRPDKANEISNIVEQEAYRSELKRGTTLAHA